LSEETYDPNRSVMTNDQHTKETTATGSAAGVPGTESNLPRATPRPSSSTHVTRESSNTTYQTTRTIKRTKMPQGTLKRLSVSVLVDETSHWEGRGTSLHLVVTPPPQQTLDRITEVVSAAVGIVPERGDRLVVESLPFETTREEPPPDALKEPPAQPQRFLDKKQLVTGMVLVVLLGVLFFAVRSRRRFELKVAAEAPPLALPAAAQEAAPPQQLTATPFAKQLENQRVKEQERQKELEAAGAALQKLIEGAVDMSHTNSELCAGVLRSWLNQKADSVPE
jgi:flagellar M-ring protein FliF